MIIASFYYKQIKYCFKKITTELINLIINSMNESVFYILLTGDWGLGLGIVGIGDWAQSPIPNPQSPIPKVLDNDLQVLKL